MLEQTENEGLSGLEIAIIGMAGEFPGAKNIKEFWNNLKNNVNSISIFTDDFLREVGVKPELLANPRYVKAGAFIENKMKFDAFFFGYSPREAELMVPEMRIFHHSVWSAMEDAGYIPDSYPGKIGLYAGASASSYWEMTTMLTGKSATIGEFASRTFVDKDQLNMRISYNLNLSGPSLAIHAACSTSLVAIHLACQGILSGDCEMALAGGVSLLGGSKPRGYLYQEGIIYSPDGYCRPFDADSNGTVIGEGVGVVVLKALDNAIADNDNIYAVIKGSAVNNDGHAKMGYSTPSGKGQAQVIFDAYNAAQIDPKTISYIEAHGTGTPIGDPIEIEALKSVFGTGKEKFCALGSVKSNIGHLIVAAGVAGIIKAALALKNRIIPATIHFKKPNPKIELENSPFYVLTELTPWNHGPKPLRAGVSSFGIGGSNAHVILEEAPRTTNRSTSLPPISGNNFLLSAKTKSALEKMTMDFQDYLKDNPGINLDDAAYTLKVGRRYLEYREMLTGDTRMSATIMPGNGAKYLVFLFPGDGTQYPGMGKELYLEEPAFANHIKDGFETLKSVMDNDRNNENNDPNGKEFLYPDLLTPPMLFVFQYALAKLMIDWGVKPSAVMGTGIGKYTAACLSGVFSTTEALTHILSKGTPGKEIYGEDQVKLKPFDLDDKLAEQLEQKEVVFITVGPGETLETHVTSHPKKKESHRVISLVKLPGENSPDSHFLRMEMEKLWLYGIDINWNKYYEGRQRNRVSLPTYPFEGEDFYDEKELKHQFENLLAGKTAKTRREDIGDWMYVPVWEQSFAADCQYREPLNNVDWLVFSDDIGIGDQLVEIMPINAGHIIIVKAGIQFQKKSNREFIINPGIDDDYELLFKEIRELEKIPAKILHLWNITPEQKDIDLNQLDKSQDIGLFSILNIARAIGKLNILGNIELDIVTNNTWEVTGDESFLCPGKATIMGAVKVVPLEYPNIKCRHIDIAISSQGKPMGLLISHLKQELQRKNEDILVAIRGDYHWIERLKPMRLEKKEEKNRCLKENGVYVITGGLGGMGLTIAEYLR
ncbi:MAG: acyltransferase domain-containing protein, partial [Acidobacteria bacterium]|nr:acyltransferase domain-containing protein [Acidobacteriota bacterium]